MHFCILVTFTYTLKEICSLLNISETVCLKKNSDSNTEAAVEPEFLPLFNGGESCSVRLRTSLPPFAFSRLFLGLSGEKREVKKKKIRVVLVDIAGPAVLAEMDEEAG